MEVKLFEVRDVATMVPMMAVRLQHRGAPEAFLLRRAGYAAEQIDPLASSDVEPYVILVNLVGSEAQYDPYRWRGSARTFGTVHMHIIEHWRELQSGQVLDVQYILKETSAPKESERHRDIV